MREIKLHYDDQDDNLWYILYCLIIKHSKLSRHDPRHILQAFDQECLFLKLSFLHLPQIFHKDLEGNLLIIELRLKEVYGVLSSFDARCQLKDLLG